MKQQTNGNRQWFKVTAKTDSQPAEVYIYDEIGAGFFGGGVAAIDLIHQIKELKLTAKDELLVRVNSPGGSVFEGTAIYNYLTSLKHTVNMRVDGVAASIASLIVMSGDTVTMPENSMMFLHNPQMLAIGNAADMRRAAEDLDTIRDSMAGSKLDKTSLYNMLDEETWLSAQEAVAVGLADTVDEPVQASALAKFDFKQYGFKVPATLSTMMLREKLKVLGTAQV
jgi:ATP-dependent Clp protease protease subunit